MQLKSMPNSLRLRSAASAGLLHFFLAGLAILACPAWTAQALEPLPEKVVVLTFDDSVKSHFTVVRPILKKYGFGATFFITEGFDFKTNKQDYMTWGEIAQLHREGFEIGNHTRDHLAVSAKSLPQLTEQLEAINQRCQENGIPRTVSFAYPGNARDPQALPLLAKAGIRFARRGGEPEYPYKEGRGVAYEPGLDHPLLIPSAGDARPDWSLEDFIRAVKLAQPGRISVLQFHGVPDRAHAWVSSTPERFDAYMKYLALHGYRVLAMRDLAKYVDPRVAPQDALGVIHDRQSYLAKGDMPLNARCPENDARLKSWLENMVRHHRFTVVEVAAATGMSTEAIADALKRWKIEPDQAGPKPADQLLRVLPYPGGRHPRIGFLDGAIRPQRDTKVSVFTPWDQQDYVVLDIPEAIRWDREPEQGLLYLAHTHVPTMWSKQGIELEPVEWKTNADGALSMQRRLPNGVVFGTKVEPKKESVRMEMWITNHSPDTLRGLRVQNCVMLKGAGGFTEQTTDNKVLGNPFAACRAAQGNRWVITAWENCQRAWGNASCPCLHSDPQFPDCLPGETKRLRGWLSFYQGDEIEEEFRRIDATGWRE